MMVLEDSAEIGIDKSLCLPKAEFNTKSSTKRRRKSSFGWVFGVQLGLRQTQALINTYFSTIF